MRSEAISFDDDGDNTFGVVEHQYSPPLINNSYQPQLHMAQQLPHHYFGPPQHFNPMNHPSPHAHNKPDFSNEPPLLEELGFNFDHIKQKTIAVLNPFSRKKLASDVLQDSDMSGPLVFGILLGFSRTLSGKWIFDYIYGFGSIGTIAMYSLMTLMSDDDNTIDLYRTVSILGYCLLPMVFLAFISLVLNPVGITSVILTTICIIWCTRCAAIMFTEENMVDQRILVAYPLALFYACFALLTLF